LILAGPEFTSIVQKSLLQRSVKPPQADRLLIAGQAVAVFRQATAFSHPHL
jgi:hypothetical protein